MTENFYTINYKKLTFKELRMFCPDLKTTMMSWFVIRTGLLKNTVHPAPNPIVQDLTAFEDIPAEFQTEIQDLEMIWTALGFEVLSYIHNPRFDSLAGIYMLHHNKSWTAFVGTHKSTDDLGQAGFHNRFQHVMAFAPDMAFSVSSSPYFISPLYRTRFLRHPDPAQMVQILQKMLHGKKTMTFQNLTELQNKIDRHTQLHHQALIRRGLRIPVPAPEEILQRGDT